MIAMAEKKPEPQAEPQAEPKPKYPDTPSGRALAEVGNVDGVAVDPDNPQPYDAAAVNAHGEAYQAAKRKHRWG